MVKFNGEGSTIDITPEPFSTETAANISHSILA